MILISTNQHRLREMKQYKEFYVSAKPVALQVLGINRNLWPGTPGSLIQADASNM